MRIKKHFQFFVGIAVYYVVIYFLKTTCIIKHITGWECLFCGTTRALVSIVLLDYDAYISYQPLALFIVAALILFIHRNLFRKKLLIHIFSGIVYIANVIWYITKMNGGI